MAADFTHLNLAVPSSWARRKDALKVPWVFVIHMGIEILEKNKAELSKKEKKTCKKNKV